MNNVGRSSKSAIDSGKGLVFRRSFAAGMQANVSGGYLTGCDIVTRNKEGRSSKTIIDSSKCPVFWSSLSTSIPGNSSGGSMTGWEEASRNNVGRSSKSAVISSKSLVFRLRGSVGSNCQQYTGKYLHCD